MNRVLVVLALLLTVAAAHAAPYPLGTLTCQDMGEFASEAMRWRESGVTREQALARLDERNYGDPVERNNLTDVLRMVFGRYGNSWTVESAGNVIRSDCETGR
jgi:hypothetical protein